MRRWLNAKEIIRVAAAYFEVPQEELLGRKRWPESVRRRNAVILTCRALGMSLPEIGKIFKRHHTTILHAVTVGAQDPAVVEASKNLHQLLTVEREEGAEYHADLFGCSVESSNLRWRQ